MKSLLINTVCLGLILCGCMKKVPYEAKAEEVRRDESAPSEKNTYAVTEGMDDPRVQPKVTQISILKGQTTFLNLNNLKPGTHYSAVHHCYDQNGKEIFRTEPYVFVAESSGYVLWAHYRPDPKKDPAGLWTWFAEVSGLGDFKTTVGVLPPTPDEMADMSRYEKAREEALRAFSHYWLGLNGTFHTVISFESKTADEEKAKTEDLRQKRSALESKIHQLTIRVETSGPSRLTMTARDYATGTRPRDYHGEWVAELADLKKQLAALPELGPVTERIDPYVGYFEAAGMEWRMIKGQLSEADRLNGITYRAEMSAAFRVFRYYREAGWTDWEDCSHLPYAFSSIFVGVPSELSGRLNLGFTLIERDHNWFITASSGDTLANGNLVKADSEWKNTVPPLRYAEELVKGGKSFTREYYKAMGEEARSHPETLEQSAISTMAMMRGRELVK